MHHSAQHHLQGDKGHRPFLINTLGKQNNFLDKINHNYQEFECFSPIIIILCVVLVMPFENTEISYVIT